jgi:hypothetical protein
MRGHEAIVAMRKAGQRPAMAWVETDGYNEGLQRMARAGVRPIGQIEVAVTERPQRLDLRCLVDLVVEVSGSDERRVGAIARACVEAGARQVIAIASTTTRRGDDFDVEIDRMTVTNEELSTWPT